ncbi:J domain-containing protein [Rhodoplanes serenus]|uniref:J domain-containing protein n=1 Tax=Rhodoplanes serenus TaxID=200615 RepID=UPI000DAD3EDE|nr:J domain-containing protein [Rhodoplanes serenus]RAI30367.1 hypothetical protein CH340_21740 [Rhodoplanes serenus]
MTTAHPLAWPDGWPVTPADKRVRGRAFKQASDHSYGGRTLVTFGRARDLLVDELRRLGAQSIVVSTNHPTGRDGFPTESKRRVADEGVAIYFTYCGRQMAMACDRYDNAAANMRSLGLAIEAMRQLDRHGGGVMMERAFAGFAALPPPGEKPPWRAVLDFAADARLTASDVEARYRHLAKRRHPDAGGSAEAMAELNAARDEALRAIRGG